MVLSFKKKILDNDRETDRLLEIKKICEARNIQIIPMVFSVGYGGDVLAYNSNLAEGFHVEHDLYKVQGDKAFFIKDPKFPLANSSFEIFSQNKAIGYHLQDGPGRISFIDSAIKNTGNNSIHFKNFKFSPHRHGRLMQEIFVKPNKSYRVTCWVKSLDIKPDGCFSIKVYGSDNRQLISINYKLSGNKEWERLTLGFNSINYRRIRIYTGVWGARSGEFWLDDLFVEGVSLINVLRRSGTPITVKNVKTGEIYEEEKDYGTIMNQGTDYRFAFDGTPITILPNSRIKNGDMLDVNYYHSLVSKNTQITLCMSESEVYDIWLKQLQNINRILSPVSYFLSMDEIRAGGSCYACKKKELTMSQILGDCVTKQYEMIKELQPNANVFIWSDMFNPQQNAHARFYYVDGNFDRSWEYIPKNITIVCWGYNTRDASLKHFSEQGFQTMVAAYNDQGIDNINQWLISLRKTPNSLGAMYTTWSNNYDLLDEFGELVLD